MNFRKIISLIMAFILMVNLCAMGAMAVLNDGKELSVDINLETGRLKSGVFTPLAWGETMKTGELLTVRICPKNDFLVGVTRYIVMFDKAFFQISGTGSGAFTANTANTFYKTVCSGYAGATYVPKTAWPQALINNGSYDKYSAVAVNNQANSNSSNGGHPGIMPGTWLFSFNLKLLKDLNAGSNARIWMDKSWIASPDYTIGASFFYKCTSASQLSANGSSLYNFDVDLSDADVSLPFTPLLQITDTAQAADVFKTKVAWYKPYYTVIKQMGLQTNVTNYAKVEWSSDNDKVQIDQNGKIVNKKVGYRSANITVKLLDSSGNVIAMDTAKVMFYKFDSQLKNM